MWIDLVEVFENVLVHWRKYIHEKKKFCKPLERQLWVNVKEQLTQDFF